MSRALRTLALVALAVALPDVASACSVCFSTTEENRWAFLATTLFLSVAPLAMIFGVGTWIRRRVLEDEARHEAVRRAAQASAGDASSARRA